MVSDVLPRAEGYAALVQTSLYTQQRGPAHHAALPVARRLHSLCISAERSKTLCFEHQASQCDEGW